MAEMKVDIISREIIKPSFSTPSHLRSYKLSTLDQRSPAIYNRIVFFYNQNDVTSSFEQKSQQLKKSLSESLSRFYPFAGRINNNITVECNDNGALYVEAKFNGLLSTFVEKLDNSMVIKQFFPAAIQSPEAASWPILQVQATLFNCGGLALGVCLSHKLCDGKALSVFMKSWAETSKGCGQTIVPLFDVASYFPPRDHYSFQLPPASASNRADESVTKKFVFDKQKIVDLKGKTAGNHGQQPTRVEVATALIWKCVMAASRSNSTGVPKKTFFMTQAVDIRKRVEPPMPEHLMGNLVLVILLETNHELELLDVVADLRKGLREFIEDKAKRLQGEEALLHVIAQYSEQTKELFMRDDTDGLFVSSLCGFKFYEAADFGWGRPTWVNFLPLALGLGKLVTLMDTRDGAGVEAWVTMSKTDMAVFERVLLTFLVSNTRPID